MSRIFLAVFLGGIYAITQAYTIYGGDAGDLASAIITGGIAHPPGYPLYTILGIDLVKIIPQGTLAWRIGFLSSISSILASLLLFELLYLFTRKWWISLVTVISTFLMYPLWLYSVVTEVFALNNLLLVSLLYFAFRFDKEKKPKYVFALAFIFGLGLSHHHLILFSLPSLLYLLSLQRKTINKKVIFRSLVFISLGLVPYIYIWLAGGRNHSLNWMGPPTLTNFLNLVTRAGYGTFTAGQFTAHELQLRLLSLSAFWDFFRKDFRLLGVLLVVLGVYYLCKKERRIFMATTLGFISYLFFLFYASFPLVENFMVGTFERFILPLYLFLSIYLAFGLYFIESFVGKLYPRPLFLKAFMLLFFIYPVSQFILNHGKISIIKNDFTAENLSLDILSNIEKDSILIISTDTPLFNTQYVYFSERKWEKIKLLHLSKLWTPYYNDQLKKLYPGLILPDNNLSSEEIFKTFIDKNYERAPIYAKQSFKTEEGVWVPYGLLFRYFKKNNIPTDTEILEKNKLIWQNIHDPLRGSLSKYENLLLSDTLKVYSIAHQESGFWAAKRGYTREAEIHLKEAQRLTPSDLDTNVVLSQVYILNKKCDQAERQIKPLLEKSQNKADAYLLLSINYAACYKQIDQADYYQKLYEESKKESETKLKLL